MTPGAKKISKAAKFDELGKMGAGKQEIAFRPPFVCFFMVSFYMFPGDGTKNRLKKVG
ncbi:hypothetical protein B4096_2985 [Heyndrickxia coagulans]|nr:hypothetical protein B4096_2985 [Heyndrickxia coagulans]